MDFTPYAGRWVALVGEQVAGVGLTPEEAVQVARRNRSKDRFVLRFVDARRGELLSLSPLLGRIRPFLQQYPQPVYLVGGAVRDLLLGRVAHDLDFVVPDGAIRLAFQVADQFGVPAYVLDRERDTGRVVLQAEQTTLDFARFRGEDLEADLRDRDFTINAMALSLNDVSITNLIDPCDGQTDLAKRQICLTHAGALRDDPVRALRVVRLAAELGFTAVAETETAIQEAASLLHLVSHERIRDELLKLMQTVVPDVAVAAMHQLGLLTAVLPEVAAVADVEQSPPHFEPVLAHTLHVVAWLVKLEAVLFAENETADPALHAVRTALFPWLESLKAYFVRVVDGVNVLALLRLAGLFHDVGKKSSQTVEANGRIRFIGHEKVSAEEAAHRLRILCMSNHTINHVQRIVRHHMRLFSLLAADHLPSRRAVFRYFRATGDAGLAVCLHALADYLAIYQGMGETAVFQRLLDIVVHLCRHYFEQYHEVVAPPALVNGRDLMQLLHVKPGPEIGRLLRLIEEAQAAGDIHTRDQALQFAQQSHS